MNRKKFLFCIMFFLLTKSFEGEYSFKTIVKRPFVSEYCALDSAGNIVIISDSLARYLPLKAIIF